MGGLPLVRVNVINDVEADIDEKALGSVVSETIQLLGDGRTNVEVNLLVTHADALRDLNLRFRGVDSTTDVLSFPGPDWDGKSLGDIAVSIEMARSGAERRGVSLDNEVTFLTVHGLLHLLGHEDDSEEGRAEMMRLTNEVVVRSGQKPDPDWHSHPH
jgi:rRNA maturation RNase YbeY